MIDLTWCVYLLSLFVVVRVFVWIVDRHKPDEPEENESLQCDLSNCGTIKMTAPTVSISTDGGNWQEIEVSSIEFTGMIDETPEALAFFFKSIEDAYREDEDNSLEPFEEWARKRGGML